MMFWQVTSAVADTVKAQVDTLRAKVNAAVDTGRSGSLEDTTRSLVAPLEEWITPAIVVVLLTALIGAIVALRNSRRALKQQKELFERQLQHETEQREVDLAREQQVNDDRASTEESRYLEWVTNQHRMLPITGLRTRSPVEVELEQVYVSLSADPRHLAAMRHEGPERIEDFQDALLETSRGEQDSNISIADALKRVDGDRVCGLVILGGPGTGKTTVMKYLALTYARGLAGERLDQSQSRLPIFIPLRDVAATERASSLADYLTQICEQAGCRVSQAFWDQKLANGDCIVLLDGLDEVANENERARVSRWIQSQWEVYSHNPFVVTCRPTGFDGTYLPPRFLRLDVQNFDEEDVARFARNWCVAVETLMLGDSEDARQKGAEAGEALIRAVEGNEGVKALAVNPLLLSIIALVHRYRARLPDRRVDLYAECVEVLLGHWDEAKDLEVSIPPGKSLQVLRPLSLWMHAKKSEDDDEPQAQRNEIVPVIEPHLASIGMRAEDADGFLNSIRDRSGLLIERGLDMFGFQHLTFQEYLAALEISETRQYDMLAEHFGESYWREVTLLCAGIKDASEFITAILALPDEKLAKEWRLLLQIFDEALSVNLDTRQAVFDRALEILKQTNDAHTAVRASLWLRRDMPNVDVLIAAFEEAEGDLAKGHFAMLLGEIGKEKEKAIEVLKPHLTDDNRHVRYLSALALDILGFEDQKALDDVLMSRVEAGEFTFGEETPHKMETGAYLIDRFPLTVGQYRKFIKKSGYQERKYWSDEGWKWKEENKATEPWLWESEQYNVLSAPVIGISLYEAEAYGEWRGKRLLSEEEWERVSRGEDSREYPWGDEFDASKCNVDEVINQPSPVGSYPEGVSSHGCYDMSGNVWEWTENVGEIKMGETVYDVRYLRGGSWGVSSNYARCAYRYGLCPRLRSSSLLGCVSPGRYKPLCS